MSSKCFEFSVFAFRALFTKIFITPYSRMRLAWFSRLRKLEIHIFLTNPNSVQKEEINSSDFTGFGCLKKFRHYGGLIFVLPVDIPLHFSKYNITHILPTSYKHVYNIIISKTSTQSCSKRYHNDSNSKQP